MKRNQMTRQKNFRKCNGCKLAVGIILAVVAGVALLRWYEQGEALRFVKKMGNGWNLGNALDCYGSQEKIGTVTDYETRWGNPVIEPELFQTVKGAGFDTVRIPVTWYEHMDAAGQIDPAWLNRVRQVVDDARAADLYVIINMHHEEWIELTDEKVDETEVRLCGAWRQIAEYFADYEEELLFEGMNEPRLTDSEYEWNGGTREARANVNRLNAAFVNTVRSCGGNNAKRYLLLPTYADAAQEEVLREMELPQDGHLIVTVHRYIPYSFAQKEDGTAKWSLEQKEDTAEIDELMEQLETYFLDRRIPVIIGEFGCRNRGNTAERVEWTRYYVRKAKESGIMCIWWDNGGKPEEPGKYGLMDREKNRWIYPEIVKELTEVEK
ncbi:MAG: glycoside hydrolase family 5 protein [Clostridiales bacterium]|nr:glycoside hydrolase family 5 protein [Clostridiales bacterium]